MKLELVHNIIEEKRPQAERFIQSHGLSWDSVRQFSLERKLADAHTIYQPKFMGMPLVLCHPAFEGMRWYKDAPIHDNGCGIGLNARYFAFDGYPKVTASDISQQMIDYGHELFRDNANSKVKFARVDARDLIKTYGSSAFGVLYDGFILHQFKKIEDVEDVLRGGSRVVGIGGVHFGMTRGTCKASYELQQVSETKTRLLLSPETLQGLLKKTGHSNIQTESTLIDDDMGELVVYYSATVV